MIFFKEVTPAHFPIIRSLYASVPEYAIMEERSLPLSDVILREEFLNPDTTSLIGYVADEPLLLVDYLPKHPNDDSAWIGLFLLASSAHGTGVASESLKCFWQQHLSSERLIHLAVFPDNLKARRFWKKHGFRFERVSISNRKQPVDVYVHDSKYE